MAPSHRPLCQHMRSCVHLPIAGHAPRAVIGKTGPYVPWASSPAVRHVMQGNRKRDTAPELSLRRALHALGLRYRVAARPIQDRPWTADLVFPRARIAVFVDGCYWHGCPAHYSTPRTNSGYWRSKIERNRVRDRRVDAELQAAGWTPLRIWEHEATEEAVTLVVATVRGRMIEQRAIASRDDRSNLVSPPQADV